MSHQTDLAKRGSTEDAREKLGHKTDSVNLKASAIRPATEILRSNQEKSH